MHQSLFSIKIFRLKRHGNSDNQLRDIMEDLKSDSSSNKGFKAIIKRKLGVILSFNIKDTKADEIINNFKVILKIH